MTKSIFSTITLLLLFSYSSIAQDTWGENLTSRGLVSTFDNKSSSIKGTPYIKEAFSPGKISIDEESKVFNIRYDAYNDIMEFKNAKNETVVLKENVVNITVIYADGSKIYHSYEYQNLEDDNDSNKKIGYFLVEDETGKKPLLIKEKIVFMDVKFATSGYDKEKPAEYKRTKDEFYTLNDEGVAINLPRKKKDLAKIFPKHSKEITAFIKSNKIKTNKKEDLVKLINYINLLNQK